MKQHDPRTDASRLPSDSVSKLTSADVDLSRAGIDLRQPHERDESPKSGGDRETVSTPLPRQVVEQAANDVARGLEDTERRGTPSNVPSQDKHEAGTASGEVPVSGIDRYGTSSRSEQLEKPAAAEHADVRQHVKKSSS